MIVVSIAITTPKTTGHSDWNKVYALITSWVKLHSNFQGAACNNLFMRHFLSDFQIVLKRLEKQDNRCQIYRALIDKNHYNCVQHFLKETPF